MLVECSNCIHYSLGHATLLHAAVAAGRGGGKCTFFFKWLVGG